MARPLAHAKPASAERSHPEPGADFAPTGALAISLGYFLLLALLWGYAYVKLLVLRG